MKNILTIALLFICLHIGNSAFSQQINWRSLKEGQHNILNITTGYEYGAIMGLGYGYKLNTKLPLVLNVEYSFPFGSNLFDDFKTKIGAQAEVYRSGNFSATAKAYGIFRRYQSDMARFVNFGSELSTVIGYYKPKWYIAGELGFDKAMFTNVKNGDVMKQDYPGVQDGWYSSTGGNFFLGLQTGMTFNNKDLYLKVGGTATQDLQSSATVPLYFLLGFNYRF